MHQKAGLTQLRMRRRQFNGLKELTWSEAYAVIKKGEVYDDKGLTISNVKEATTSEEFFQIKNIKVEPQ